MQRSGWSQGAILLKRLVGSLAPEHRLSEPSISLQISQGPTIRPLTTQSRHHSHHPCFAHSNPSVTSSDQHLESSPHLLPIDAHPCRFATSLHELLRRKPPESTRNHAVTLLFPPTSNIKQLQSSNGVYIALTTDTHGSLSSSFLGVPDPSPRTRT